MQRVIESLSGRFSRRELGRPEAVEVSTVQTTLEDCGIGSKRDLPLQFSCEPLSITTLADKNATRYFALLRHPFAGKHLGQTLSASVHSTYDPDKFATIDDWQMPDEARSVSWKTRMLHRARIRRNENLRLYELHTKDPDISASFKEFDAGHRALWMQALNYESGDAFFNLMSRHTGFQVIDPEEYVGQKKEELDKNPGRWSEAFRYGDGFPIAEFLGSFPEVHDHVEWIVGRSSEVDITDPSMYKEVFTHQIFQEYGGSFVGIAKLFEEQLPERERLKILLAFGASRQNAVLISDADASVWIPQHSKNQLQVTVDEVKPSGATVQVNDKNGNVFDIEVGIGGGKDNWKINRYGFNQDYSLNALFALFAWENRGGQRRFIGKNEVLALAARNGISCPDSADVMFGRALAALYSDVSETWRRRIPLKKGEYDQPMLAAQSAVWASMQSHTAELLSDANPFFPLLESGAVA